MSAEQAKGTSPYTALSRFASVSPSATRYNSTVKFTKTAFAGPLEITYGPPGDQNPA